MMTTYFFTALTQQARHGARPSARPRPRPTIAQWVAALRRIGRNRRHYQHLEDLPDYLLDDIGLTRADIARARRGLFD